MKNGNQNTTVYAVNNDKRGGFDIYLNFSGQQEYLMWHRHNGNLYAILKDSVRISEIRHIAKTRRYYSEMLRYLLSVIDAYMKEREYCA